MRVIICGAGQVGYNIAAYLSRENNDITIIDNDPDMIARVNEELDVNAIQGHASIPDVLAAAGAGEADMIAAVTHSDEVNMIACQVAHSLFNVPRKIARIRDRRYMAPVWANLFSRAHMPIDVIISPELEVAKAITKRLSVPGTTNVISLAEGALHFCSVVCETDCPVINTPLRQLAMLFPDINVGILAIYRNGKLRIPEKEEQMMIGDEIYFVADTNHIERILSAFGHEEKEARSVVILGGGNIGVCLAQELKEKHKGINIKIIEKNPRRAIMLSETFTDFIILNGDGLNKTILEEANMQATETLVAVTEDDETNILASILARQYGCDRTITLLNKSNYNAILGPLALGTTVSPRAITSSTIMQYVRRGRIREIHTLLDGEAEVIEVEISDNTAIVNTPLKDIHFPKGILIGAILRKGGEVIIPSGETVMKPQDHVVLFVLAGASAAVEKIFSVQVDLF
ncbi:MAG: Trk system potassium transporter TrkA [Alphaproteobacteria bacterium]|nr:Trk system potassium transporter TrkA [Alphaproteobacteria bacterium]